MSTENTKDKLRAVDAAVTGSALYGRVVAPSDDPLMHKVWQGTPWMMDAHTGSINSDRWHDVIEWCRENYGPEAWPIHDRPGQWHTGGATIHGWTWLGFATEEMMTAFAEHWQSDKLSHEEGEIKP